MRLRAGRLVQDSGQALIEYALILALASLGIVSALMILQGSLGNSMQASSHQIDAAGEGRAGEPLPGGPAASRGRYARDRRRPRQDERLPILLSISK